MRVITNQQQGSDYQCNIQQEQAKLMNLRSSRNVTRQQPMTLLLDQIRLLRTSTAQMNGKMSTLVGNMMVLCSKVDHAIKSADQIKDQLENIKSYVESIKAQRSPPNENQSGREISQNWSNAESNGSIQNVWSDSQNRDEQMKDIILQMPQHQEEDQRQKEEFIQNQSEYKSQQLRNHQMKSKSHKASTRNRRKKKNKQDQEKEQGKEEGKLKPNNRKAKKITKKNND